MTAPVRPESEGDRLARIRRNLARLKAQNAPPAEVEKYLSMEQTTPERERGPATNMERGAQALGAVAQGATFGLTDELAGAMGALTGQGYDKQRDIVRESLGEFREAAPVTSTLLEAGGSMVVPFSAAGKVAKLAGPGVAKSVARNAIDAGVVGAASGAANAEGSLLDRAKAALGTGTVAAVGGGVLGAAVPAVKAVARRAGNAAGVGSAGAADEVIRTGVEADPSVLSAAQRALDDMAKAGRGDEAMLADVLGKPGARMARGARSRSSVADQLLDERLGGRNAAAGDRIQRTMMSETGATGEGAATVRDRMIDERAAAAAPLYDEARGAGDIFALRTEALAAREAAAAAPKPPESLNRLRERLPMSLKNLSDEDLQAEWLARVQADGDDAGMAALLDDPRITDALNEVRGKRSADPRSRQKVKADQLKRARELYGEEGEALNILSRFGEDATEQIRNAGYEVEDVQAALDAAGRMRQRAGSAKRIADELAERGLEPGAAGAAAAPLPNVPRTVDTSGDRIEMGLGDIIESAPVRSFIAEALALPQFKGMVETDMRVMDYVYKQLGRKAETTADASKKYVLDEIRRNMARELSEANPRYGEAMQEFAGRSELIDAFNTGSAFLGGKSDEFTAALSKLSKSEQEAVRRGAAEALISRIRKLSSNADLGPDVRSRDVAQAIMGDDDLAARYRQVFGEESYQRILPALKAEIKMFGTSNVARGGSNTADKMLDAGLGGEFTGGSFLTMAMNAASKMNRSLPDRGAEQVAERLTRTGQQNVKEELDALMAALDAQRIARETGRTGIQRGARAIGSLSGGLARQ